jgi:Flp pilus assembly protein TadG
MSPPAGPESLNVTLCVEVNRQVTVPPGSISTSSGEKVCPEAVTRALAAEFDDTPTVAVAVRVTLPLVIDAVTVTVPTVTPVITPVALTVALAGSLELQVAAGNPAIASPF